MEGAWKWIFEAEPGVLRFDHTHNRDKVIGVCFDGLASEKLL